MPDGSSVTWSSQRSARRSDSATAVRSASDDGWCPAASWLIAPWRARSQFTGPPDQLIIFCSSANRGILPSRSSGYAATGDPAEEGTEAEGVTGGVAACRPRGARGHGRGARSRTARHSCIHGRRVIFPRGGGRLRLDAVERASGRRGTAGRPKLARRDPSDRRPDHRRRAPGGVRPARARLLPVPYVAQVPGPTFNTLGDIDGSPIITVHGRDRNKVSGQPQPDDRRASAAAGVSLVRGRPRLVRPTRSRVVPEESVYPPGRTDEETRQANREAFLTSEQAAETAALGHLGLPAEGRGPGGCRRVRRRRACSAGRHHRRGRRARPTPDRRRRSTRS